MITKGRLSKRNLKARREYWRSFRYDRLLIILIGIILLVIGAKYGR